MTHRVLLTALLLVVAALPSRAAEKVLQNESLESFEGRLTGLEIVEGEVYASRFEAAPGDYPIRLKAVRFVMVGNGAEDARCGAFSIAVWRDGGTIDAGDLIFDTEKLGDVAAGGTVAIIKASPSAMQQLPLEGQLGDMTLIPVEIQSGAFRIGLRYAGECPGELSPAPILIHDATGGASVHSYIFGAAPGQPRQWLSTSALAMGEWVLRAVVETSGAPDPADPGPSSDAGPSSADPGGATGDPGAQPVDGGGGKPDPGTGSDATPAADGAASGADAGDANGAPAGDEPKITGVEPGFVNVGEASDISIQGSGFAAGAEVTLTPGAHALAVKAAGVSVIDATVPANVPLGTYGVVVTNPGGAQAVAAGALTVIAAPGGGGGCAAGNGGAGHAAALFVLLLGCLVLARRRRSP